MGKRSAYNSPAIVDHIMTSVCALSFLVACWVFSSDLTTLAEFFGAIAATMLLIRVSKFIFTGVGNAIGREEVLAQPRNLRKFVDQSWQLSIHVFFTTAEYLVLAENNFEWWNDTTNCWKETEVSSLCRRVYVLQLAVWFYTAYSHRFVEAVHKDYFVMYGHHVVTIVLVGLSYQFGYVKIGILVLLVHDASDIPVDLLKMTNYMGLDEKSGLFITEICFVSNLISWAWLRMYLYPFKIVWSAVFESDEHCNRNSMLGCQICRVFLCVLECMHIWWFFLFCRIAYRLMAKEGAHDAGREEYEGTSASDNDIDPPTAKKRN